MLVTEPMLAADWCQTKVKFPVDSQPKIDGFRGCNLWGRLTARTLRPFDNKFITQFFSHEVYSGMDGELAAADEVDPLLCSLTNTATSTVEGQPWLMWHVFDWLHPKVNDLPYRQRHSRLAEQILCLKHTHPELGAHLKLVPSVPCETMAQLEEQICYNIVQGYEGTIIRNPMGAHKNGRSSPYHGGLLRIKNFMEVDCIIESIVEGQRNDNEATLDRLGRTERSTHKENMVPNGRVGTVIARLCEDAIHPITGKLVHKKDDRVEFGAGRMTHPERERYFKQPDLILGHHMKGQIFPYGVKDKPRFPTFQSLRQKADIVKK